MIGSHYTIRRAGFGSFDITGKAADAAKNRSDVGIQRAKSLASIEQTRLRQIAAVEKARIGAQPGTNWSKWAPLIVVGAAIVAGGIVLAIRARKGRSKP